MCTDLVWKHIHISQIKIDKIVILIHKLTLDAMAKVSIIWVVTRIDLIRAYLMNQEDHQGACTKSNIQNGHWNLICVNDMHILLVPYKHVKMEYLQYDQKLCLWQQSISLSQLLHGLLACVC